MSKTPSIAKGHQRWFRVNCSMMLYRWTGQDWEFTGQAVREPGRVKK
jgi:hypothetical protein